MSGCKGNCDITTITKGSKGDKGDTGPAGSLPYKVYTALLTQTGTSAPVATVLGDNTIGNIVWSRVSAGQYLGTLAGAFTVGKTTSPQFPLLTFNVNGNFIPVSSNGNPQLGWYNMYKENSYTDHIELDTYNMVGREEWSIVVGEIFVEIRVYN